MTALDPTALLSLQAAVRAGAAPAEALAATGDGVLGDVARQARLGRSLSDMARETSTGDGGADLLVRCLALAERFGAGAGAAVEQALSAVRDQRRTAQLLEVRATQARGTAAALAIIPPAAWVLLLASDPTAIAFYATPAGAVSAVSAVGLSLLSWRWMQRLVRSAGSAGVRADPLAPQPAPRRWRRSVVAGVTVSVVTAPLLGLAAVLAGAAVTSLTARRRAAAPGGSAGGAAETVLLVAVALEAGMGPLTAVEEVAAIAPEPARPALATAAARMAGGQSAAEALKDTPLATLGTTLTATQRWGAPAAPALRHLAEQLREDRRAAAEIAGERLQLHLVFPTTLLTLPAFVLGVVPPLLWSTLRT